MEEKARKELEECSFAPKINKGNKKRGDVTRRGQQTDRTGNYIDDDEEDEPRDVETFVADQQKFLAQKAAKENALKRQIEQQKEQDKAQVTKINKKSLQILE